MDKHYQFTYKGIKLDPYRILKVYGISDPAQQHAIKKLLRAGESVKPLKEDIKEVILSLTRWLEMLEDEDSACEEFDVEPLEEALAEKTHKILNKEEALKALREGYKLTCKEWDEDEVLFMRGVIFDELDRKYSDRELNQILEDFELYIKCQPEYSPVLFQQFYFLLFFKLLIL